MDWVRLHSDISDYVLHIANERKCSMYRGRTLKRMGVKAGVADIFVMIPSGVYHGLWIEMKIKPNKPTKTQLAFLSNAESKGYATKVCFSCDDAIETVKEYLKLD